MADQWYYTSDGQPRDPVSREELIQLANRGMLKPTDLVWTEGMPKWIRASSAEGIFADTAASSAVTGAPRSNLRTDGVESADDLDERRPRRRRERARARWEDDDYAEPVPRRRGMGTGAKLGIILGCVLAVLAIGGVILYLALDGGVGRPTEYSVSLNAQRSDSRRIEFKAGMHYRITVTSDRNSDVDILIFDSNNQVVAFDESIGPNSLVMFAPRATGAFRVEIRNLGPGSNRSQVRFDEMPVAQAPPPAFKPPAFKPPDFKMPDFKMPDFKMPDGKADGKMPPFQPPGQPPSIRNVPGKQILNTSGQLTLTDPIDTVRPHKCRCKTFTVLFQAGKKYHIVLERPLNPKGSSIDPFLRLEDEGGRPLRENDDGGGDFGLNSYIFYQPAVTGNHRVIATSLTPRIGPFTLRVHEE